MSSPAVSVTSPPTPPARRTGKVSPGNQHEREEHDRPFGRHCLRLCACGVSHGPGLSGRVAVVTGGSSGIGLAIAQVLLAEGADVALCGRSPERLSAAGRELADKHGKERVLATRCDVLSADDCKELAAAVSRWRGRCDLLVNNAGQARMSTFAETT